MANSIITVDGDGSTTQYALNFTLGILKREYVTCRVGTEVDGLGDPVYRALEWITDGLVNIQGAVPGNGVEIIFRRTVPKNMLIHDYSDGVPITEENLDGSNLQNLMAIQEFLDGRLEGGFVQDINMNGFKFINLAPGTDAGDSVNKAQLDAVEAIANETGDAAAAAAASAAAALVSENNAETAELSSAAFSVVSSNWASQIGAFVTGSLLSAREWAVGTYRRGFAGYGSAKDWANYTGGTVDNVEYSAKKYAQDAAATAASIPPIDASGTPAANDSLFWNTGTANFVRTSLANLVTILNNAGLAPKASPTFTGVPAVPTAATGTNTTQAASTAFVLANAGNQIQPLTASVAANALTLTFGATSIDFRNASLGTGGANRRAVDSANLVIPSGATLGTISGQSSRLVAIDIDNAGTVIPAVVNIAGGVNLNEEGVINTTLLNGSSNSADVVYASAAVTNMPYRVRGFVNSTQATAGTWATAPSLVAGVGGNVATALGSVGYGQSWQAVTRVSGTTYYNTTGKPIFLAGYFSGMAASGNITVNGVTIGNASNQGAGQIIGLYVMIPPNASYVVGGVAGTLTCTELR